MTTGNVLEGVAFEYIERGVSVIPINSASKKPFVKWKNYQDALPTEDDIIQWQVSASRAGISSDEIRLAVVTGQLSGFVVVDCDTPEAIQYCKDHGVWSPIRAKTKNGIHLYFKHDQQQEYRPRVGGSSKGIDWPQISGLDFRGDGSYALCPPSIGYSWDIDPGYDAEDMTDWPVWHGWPMEEKQPTTTEAIATASLASLDLSNVTIKDPRTMWEQTQEYVKLNFPSTLLIPSGRGNNRNNRVLQYAAEQLHHGFYGEKLDIRVQAFMDHFYEDRLDTDEWQATARSVEEMERRNHPERFQPEGFYAPPFHDGLISTEPEAQAATKEQPEAEDPLEGLLDPFELADKAANHVTKYYVRPIVPNQSIIQVAGYSGQNKSTFVQQMIYSILASQERFGPFWIEEAPKILYLNYEESMRTVKDRNETNRKMFGRMDPHIADKIRYYYSSIDGHKPMYLNTKEGLTRLNGMMQGFRPDVLVIDTIRSAWPGMEENNSEAWTPVNRVLEFIRDKFYCSVIMLHHNNKADSSGNLGSYAGSTAQINRVENQLAVTLLYENETLAKNRGGVYDERDPETDRTIHDRFRNLLPTVSSEWMLDTVMRLDTKKLRHPEPEIANSTYMATATNLKTEEEIFLHLPSPYDLVINYYKNNLSVIEIAVAMKMKTSFVRNCIDDHLKRTT